jgi:hypothetical protein
MSSKLKTPTILPDGWVSPNPAFYPLDSTLVLAVRYGNGYELALARQSPVPPLAGHTVSAIKPDPSDLWWSPLETDTIIARDDDGVAPWVPDYYAQVRNVMANNGEIGGAGEYAWASSRNKFHCLEGVIPGSVVIAYQLDEGDRLNKNMEALSLPPPLPGARRRKLDLGDSAAPIVRSVPTGGMARDQRLPGAIPVLQSINEAGGLIASSMMDAEQVIRDPVALAALEERVGHLYGALDVFAQLNRLDPTSARSKRGNDLMDQRKGNQQ